MATSRSFALLLLSTALFSLSSASCCKKRLSAITGEATEEASATPRGVVLETAIPGDQAAYFVRSSAKTARVVLYLPPRCEEVVSTLKSFGPAASAQSFVIMLVGDQPCPGSTFRHFSPDPALIERRFDAAVAALSKNLPGELDATTAIVMGYSEGASRAQDVVAHAPLRFTRALLIGAPETPHPGLLSHARAVATMAGEHDRHDLMMLGTQELGTVHVPSKFFILPGANHGEFGPEGGRVVTEAIAWMLGVAP